MGDTSLDENALAFFMSGRFFGDMEIAFARLIRYVVRTQDRHLNQDIRAR